MIRACLLYLTLSSSVGGMTPGGRRRYFREMMWMKRSMTPVIRSLKFLQSSSQNIEKRTIENDDEPNFSEDQSEEPLVIHEHHHHHHHQSSEDSLQNENCDCSRDLLSDSEVQEQLIMYLASLVMRLKCSNDQEIPEKNSKLETVSMESRMDLSSLYESYDDDDDEEYFEHIEEHFLDY